LMNPIMRSAQVLWDFLSEGHAILADSDIVVVCGSYDLRVCDHACELMKQGIAPHLLITGNTGNWTRYLWSQPEAEIFAHRAQQNGLAEEQIILEPKATNFAENIAFARQLMPEARRVTFVTKPYSIRRIQQTLPLQWPGTEAAVSAPKIAFPDDVSNIIGVFGLIEEMVGDLHRMQVYPELGFQAPIEIPEPVISAWQRLIDAGFDRHLVAGMI